jgi:hypothetical protein
MVYYGYSKKDALSKFKKLDSDGDGVPDNKDCQPYNSKAQGTNKQVAESFAEGKSDSSGAMFSEGDVIYSYGKHFPIAVKLEDGTYLFNKDKYSPTSSKHQSLVRNALRNAKIKEVSTEEIKKVAESKTTGDLQGKKFNESKEYVQTDGWRGYEKHTYAVAGVTDTGEWEDSPHKGSETVPEIKKLQSELKSKGISSKIVTAQTSNVFAVNHELIVKPKDQSKAKEIVKVFVQQTKPKHVFEE